MQIVAFKKNNNKKSCIFSIYFRKSEILYKIKKKKEI